MPFPSRVSHLLIPLAVCEFISLFLTASKRFHSSSLNLFNSICFWKADFRFFRREFLHRRSTLYLTKLSFLPKMSSNELIAEILALTGGLGNFNNFQILNIDQNNNLFAFAPQLIEFEQSCGGELQQLLELSQSSVFDQLIESNLDLAGSVSPCLEQLLGLEQLFESGQDNLQLNNSNNVDNNNSNSTEVVNNSTATASSSSAENTAAAANLTQNANNQNNGKDQNGKDAKGKDKDKGKDNKKNGKRGEIAQRSGASKKQVLGSFGLGLMVIVGAFAL